MTLSHVLLLELLVSGICALRNAELNPPLTYKHRQVASNGNDEATGETR